MTTTPPSTNQNNADKESPIGFRGVWTLALISAVSMAAFPLMALMGSILGAQLSPAEQWATLPVALMVIGTAVGVIPAARSMGHWGRKKAFLLFMGIGIGACLVAGESLRIRSFSLFCLSTFFLGVANAALAQVRFAAMECVPLSRAPTAASIIMCAGIVAAFIGPELAVAGRSLSSVEFRGSFWLAAACLILGAVILALFYQAAAQSVAGEQDLQPRPLRQIAANPRFLLAIGSGAVAYVVMSLVMTATPISMHLHQGYDLEDTKWVIQSHVAAMFLPSLITVWLFRLLGIKGLMVAGLACFAVTIVIGLANVSVLGYWGQLVMLGIGWNFLFVSGTALLPSSYRTGEHLRAQAANDSVIFSTQAIAALSAGWAISIISWQTLLLVCLVPMGFMVFLLLWENKVEPIKKSV
jgi:MFS family permease